MVARVRIEHSFKLLRERNDPIYATATAVVDNATCWLVVDVAGLAARRQRRHAAERPGRVRARRAHDTFRCAYHVLPSPPLHIQHAGGKPLHGKSPSISAVGALLED
jgi:hypothetical protein